MFLSPALGQSNKQGQLYAEPTENTIDINLNTSLNYSMTIVDDFVMETNSDQFASFQNLAIYLTSQYAEEKSQIRSIYSWIALNISYNQNSLITDNRDSQSAPNVWQSKLAVCEGYAKLFHEMCHATGIESRIIKGYVKDFSIEDLKFPNHAWNSVKINGKWCLLDVTWASVNNESSILVNNNMKQSYTRHKLDHFFLVNPNQMILTHLPEDPYWQLQNNFINMETFLNSDEDIKSALLNPNAISKDFELLIANYDALDSLDKSISYLERMEKNKWNRVKEYGLGVAYYYKAQKILKESTSMDSYDANQLAKLYFIKSLDQLTMLQKKDYGYDFSQDLANSVAFRIESLQ